MHARFALSSRVLCLQLSEAGSLAKLNKILDKLGISLVVGVKQNGIGLERPSLDGPTAAAIISVSEVLIDALNQPNKKTRTPAEIRKSKMWGIKSKAVWRQWRWIAQAMSVVDPKRITVDQKTNFGKNCRRFGLYWRDAFSADYMKSFYLHTLFHHGIYPRSALCVVLRSLGANNCPTIQPHPPTNLSTLPTIRC